MKTNMNIADKAALAIAYIEYKESEITIAEYAEKYEYSDIEDAISALIFSKSLLELEFIGYTRTYLEWLSEINESIKI